MMVGGCWWWLMVVGCDVGRCSGCEERVRESLTRQGRGERQKIK